MLARNNSAKQEQSIVCVYIYIYSDQFQQYGCAWIEELGKHLFDEEEDCQTQLGVEWQFAKYDLAAWREEVPQTILDGSGSATEWCLIKLQNPSIKRHYPLLSGVAEVALVEKIL